MDQAYEGCRPGSPAPTEYGDGVVTPHASFPALRYAPRAALTNLRNLRRDFDAYGRGGFYDAIGVRSGDVARRYLSLDQHGHGRAGQRAGRRRHAPVVVARGELRQELRPLMRQEVFASALR